MPPTLNLRNHFSVYRISLIKKSLPPVSSSVPSGSNHYIYVFCPDAQHSFQMVDFLRHVKVLVSMMHDFREISRVCAYFCCPSSLWHGSGLVMSRYDETNGGAARVNTNKGWILSERVLSSTLFYWRPQSIDCHMHLRRQLCWRDDILIKKKGTASYLDLK